MPASSDLSVYAQQMKEASAALGNGPSVTDPSYLTGQISASRGERYGTVGSAGQASASRKPRLIIKALRPVSSQVSQTQTALPRQDLRRQRPDQKAACKRWHLRQKYWKKSQPLWQMACRHTQKEWIRRQTAVQLLHQGWKPAQSAAG